jgi:hypothetical protein
VLVLLLHLNELYQQGLEKGGAPLMISQILESICECKVSSFSALVMCFDFVVPIMHMPVLRRHKLS